MKKGLRVITTLILAVFFLAGARPCYSESSAEASYMKGMEHAIQGSFAQARQHFEESLKIDPTLERARDNLKTIEDVMNGKTKEVSAIHLFKGIANADKEMVDQAVW